MPRGLLLSLLVASLVAGCARGADPQAPQPAEKAAATIPAPGWEKPLQGRWRVESSTGKPDSGHVFIHVVGQELTIAGDRLSGTFHGDILSKKLIPRPDVAPQAFDLEVDEPRWKTWSRVAFLMVAGKHLSLCVNFPQGPRPARIEPADDGRECVEMEWAGPANAP